MAAPLQNTNRMCNGSRTTRPALAIATLSKRYSAICQEVRRYARIVRRLVAERHGKVTHGHEEEVNEAARQEMCARIYMYEVNTNPKMSPSEVANLLQKVTLATQYRRNAIQRLGITDVVDGNGTDPAGLYAETPQEAHTEPAATCNCDQTCDGHCTSGCSHEPLNIAAEEEENDDGQ